MVTPSTNDPGRFNCQAPDNEIEAGCATAIDRRGYFLAAANNVEADRVYLVLGQGAARPAERARVVWRGNPSKRQPDLAILHVPVLLEHVYEWATNAHVGDPVMAVGLSRARTNFLGPEFLAGTILDFTEWRGEPGFMHIEHNVPGQGDDTGGPLVTEDGLLLGINFTGKIRLYLILPRWKFFACAVRPNRQWLRDAIEKDAAAL